MFAKGAGTARIAAALALAAPTVFFAGYEFAQKSLLPAYLAQSSSLSIGTIGAILVAMRALAIVANGLAGAACDAFGPLAGRRRFWMALATPLSLGATWIAFTASTNLSTALLVGVLAVMTIAWAASNIAHGAWTLEAATDFDGRSLAFGIRTAAGFAGLLAFSALASRQGGVEADQLRAIAWALAIGAPLASLLLFASVNDGPKPKSRPSMGVLVAPFGLALSDPRNRRLALLFAGVGASAALGAGSFVFIAKYGLGLADASGGFVVQALACVIGLPIGLAFSKARGPQAALLTIFAIRAALFVALPFLPSGSSGALLVWSALLGLLGGVDFTLLRALAGEALDADRAATGEARAGQYYAAFHLPYNLAGAVVTGLLFFGLQALGFDADRLDAPANRAIALWLPALLGLALSLASIWSLLTGRAGFERHRSEIVAQL